MLRGHQVTAETFRVPSFLMCSLSLIMLSAPNSGKHRMETEQLQFKYWVLVLDFQLCVLHCGGSGLCMQCLTKLLPRHFALDHVHYEMSNFELTELLVPWSICCVENNIDEKAQRPLWTTYPKLRNLAINGFAVLANKCAEEDANASRLLAVHCHVCMS